MVSNKQHSTNFQTGFSLVEILVGLVIGLLATLVIMQVFSVFEGQKRTTTGSADAQTNGSIALYSLSRELKGAGYGLLPVANSAIKCDAPNIDASAAANGVTSLSPVTIVDGAGASDEITMRYGNSATAGIPMPISLMVGTLASVDNNLYCGTGVGVVLTSANTCNVTSIVPAANTTDITIGVASSATAGNELACLGQWSEVTFRVNADNLERNGTPVVADIVNMQAQYGISNAANSNQIVQWVDASGAWAAPTTVNRNRIKALRIAVVARNGIAEKENVSEACSSLTTNTTTGICAWSGPSAQPAIASPAPQITLVDDSDGTSWQRYRYRVFETIVPLRNVIWSRETL